MFEYLSFMNYQTLKYVCYINIGNLFTYSMCVDNMDLMQK